jgi:tetratricopeptide (TPR) repeat protein
MNKEGTITLREAIQELAKSANHQVWDLLEKTKRSKSEDEDMLLAAYSSLHLWKEAGTAGHAQRGSWLIAKVHLSLQQAENAVLWAEKCLQITENHSREMQDFDLAYAQEGLARAYALAGNLDLAKKHWAKAAALGEEIQDPEDREIFWKDFRGGDWYQLPID